MGHHLPLWQCGGTSGTEVVMGPSSEGCLQRWRLFTQCQRGREEWGRRAAQASWLGQLRCIKDVVQLPKFLLAISPHTGKFTKSFSELCSFPLS